MSDLTPEPSTLPAEGQPQEPVEAPVSPAEPQEEPDAPDEQDEEEQDESEPQEQSQEEPDAFARPGSRAFEKAERSLATSVKTYLNAVNRFAEATGQSLILNESSLEWAPGFNFHPQVAQLSEEQAQFARLLLGEGLRPNFAQDPQARECPTCEGWGQVKTGSKINPHTVIRCRQCQGRGYVGPAGQTANGAAPALELAPEPPEGEPVASRDDLDPWGTPPAHPDFGKMPQYREPGWQEALDAWKRGEPAPVAAL